MTGHYGGYEESEFLAELYDYANTGIGGIDFYVDCSKRASGPTLELGCGTGRILIPTAVAGCEITGLDISSNMLRKCREKLELQSFDTRQRVHLIHGNMTNFSIDRSFSLITIPFNTFQLLITVEEQKACLCCVSDHLSSDGVFVLDVFNPDLPRLYDRKYLQEREELSQVRLPDGRILRSSSRIAAFHRAEQVNLVELIYYVRYPDGREDRLVRAFPLRYLFRYEVEHLLALCGFEVTGLFGDYDQSAYSDESPKMLFVAKKRTVTK